MIDQNDIECARLLREIRAVLHKLALISHAPIQGYNFAPNDVGAGDRWRLRDTRPPIPHLGAHSSKAGDSSIPRGNIDYHGDRTPEYRQKSAEYFAGRLGRMNDDHHAHTASDLRALLRLAEESLEAWQKTPLVAGARPALGDPRWKYWAANCDHTTADLVRWYGISRQHLQALRRQYREDAA